MSKTDSDARAMNRHKHRSVRYLVSNRDGSMPENAFHLTLETSAIAIVPFPFNV